MKFVKQVRNACVMAAAFAACTGAHAQLFRAYLASTGADSNPCTVAAPCRLLPAALNAVADGGEIWMLDSANYNTATVAVTKSVTILAIPGVVGSLVAAGGGPAILLDTAGKNLALRNLVVTNLAASPGTHGVFVTNGDSLTVENCNFYSLVNDGIQVDASAKVRVARSVFTGNNVGVRAAGAATVSISDSSFFDNGFSGILADGFRAGPTVINVSDSVVTASQFGIIAWSKAATANPQIFAKRVTVTATLEGIVSYRDPGMGTATVTLGGSLVSGNDTGLVQAETTVLKVFGDNQVSDNITADTLGTITTVARQ
jgi:hypothetical protein